MLYRRRRPAIADPDTDYTQKINDQVSSLMTRYPPELLVLVEERVHTQMQQRMPQCQLFSLLDSAAHTQRADLRSLNTLLKEASTGAEGLPHDATCLPSDAILAMFIPLPFAVHQVLLCPLEIWDDGSDTVLARLQSVVELNKRIGRTGPTQRVIHLALYDNQQHVVRPQRTEPLTWPDQMPGWEVRPLTEAESWTDVLYTRQWLVLCHQSVASETLLSFNMKHIRELLQELAKTHGPTYLTDAVPPAWEQHKPNGTASSDAYKEAVTFARHLAQHMPTEPAEILERVKRDCQVDKEIEAAELAALIAIPV